MEGNRKSFSAYLHGSLLLVTLALGTFGVLGYLQYGHSTRQIIIQNIPQHTPVAICVQVTLIIGVLCTYPLQIFPCIEMLEHFLFLKGEWREDYRHTWPHVTATLWESKRIICVLLFLFQRALSTARCQLWAPPPPPPPPPSHTPIS